MKIIPLGMAKEINLDVGWDPLKHSHLFRSKPTEFLRLISPYVKQTFLMPGEFIFKKNHMKSQMVYIISGVIQILSEQDEETPIISLSGGTCIGESSLLIDYPSSYTVICQSACEVSILTRKDFLKTYLKYPNKYKLYLKDIKNRYSETKNYYNAKLLLWDGTKREKETLTLKWIKSTLQELMTDQNIPKDNFSALTMCQDNNLIFCTKYLDLFTVTKKTALITDLVFLRDTCPAIFQPNSFIVNVWNKVIEVTAFAFMIVYPYYASFEPDTTTWYFIFSYFVLVLWILDIYVAFSTAVKEGDQFLTTIKEIAIVRIQNLFFVFDLVSVIPLELILYIIDNARETQNIVMLQVLRLAKCYRIENLFRDSKLKLKWIYLKLITYMLLLIYYLAALLYLYSGNNSTNDLLFPFSKNVSNHSPSVIFIYAGLLAQEMTNKGSKITLKGDYKLLLIKIGMGLLPFFFYMYFMSSAVAMETLTKFDQLKGQIFLSDIMCMMKKVNIKPHLSNLVIRHVQNQLKQNYAIDYKSPYRTIEKKCHPVILQNMYMSKYGSILKSIPLFYNLPKEVILEIAGKCQNLIIEPNEIVTFAGETCKELYIILKGYCQIISSTETANPVLKPNYVVSALEMFLDIPIVHTVITLTHCDLIVIPCNELKTLLFRYPNIMSEFHTVSHVVAERYFPDWTKESSSYVLETTIIEHPPSFKHFGYCLSRNTKAAIEYHKSFDELKSFSCIRYLLLRHTIKPNGKFLKYWEISRCVFAFTTAIITPIIPISTCTRCGWYYLTLFLDVTAWIDIYLRHHICYFNKENIEVSHPLQTAINYWKNALIIDLLGVFPIDGIIISFFNIDDNKTNRVILKMIKLLQSYRIVRGIAYLNNNLISPPKTWVVLQYLPVTILLINTIGAITINSHCKFESSIESSQNFTNGVYCPPNMWLTQPLFEKPLSPLRIYLYGDFYATIITAGPTLQNFQMNAKETIQTAFISVIGYVYFIYIAARIIASTLYINSDRILHQQTISSLIKFLSCRRLDIVLKQEIIAHFEYVHETQQNMQTLIKQIGCTLEAEVLLDVFGEAMKDSIVFGNAPDSFLKNLLVHMHQEIILNRGIICKINDIHNKIYFIVKGNVDVVGADYNRLINLPKGSLFGTLDTINQTRQKLTMVAKGHVELLSISSSDFYKLLSNYSQVKNQFLKLIIFNNDYVLEPHIQAIQAAETSPSILGGRNRLLLNVINQSSIWETFIMACVYLGCFVELYLITMQDHTIIEIIFVYVCDILFIVNIYFNFHFQYKDEYGIIITDKKKIAKRYMKKPLGFYFALASVLPLEIVSLFFINYGNALNVWNLCRFNRLLKIFILIRYLNKTASKLSTNILITTLTFGVKLSLIIEILTSTIIIISCSTPQSNLNPVIKCNWANATSTIKFNIYVDQYASITNIVTGTALVKSPNSPILIFLFIIILIGFKFLASVIIKEIVVILELLLRNKVQYEKITYELKHYMGLRNTSTAILNRVRDYLFFLWKHKRGYQFPILLDEAPYYLREGILNSLYGYLLRTHPVFGLCHVDLIRQISSKMRPVTFLHGDYIAFKNDVDECMYFVHEGGVDSISEETKYYEKIAKTISAGEVFGYEAGLHPNCSHMYSYRANQLTLVVILKREDWIYLLEFFPASKNILLNQ
ncbi:hypothetical protein RN001_007912 [Aquatica leii]|uniref:Cyclic nucleotide-binding domain-containing protein n=1 Tax=Aquatica leii TaxID=1421715 RepID=A0AAN7S9B7_9COLE|nr:hypothetical protein RN001_007912 [Aquatica leii]